MFCGGLAAYCLINIRISWKICPQFWLWLHWWVTCVTEIRGTSCLDAGEVGQHGQCCLAWVYIRAPKYGVDISMVVQKELSILTSTQWEERLAVLYELSVILRNAGHFSLQRVKQRTAVQILVMAQQSMGISTHRDTKSLTNEETSWQGWRQKFWFLKQNYLTILKGGPEGRNT